MPSSFRLPSLTIVQLWKGRICLENAVILGWPRPDVESCRLFDTTQHMELHWCSCTLHIEWCCSACSPPTRSSFKLSKRQVLWLQSPSGSICGSILRVWPSWRLYSNRISSYTDYPLVTVQERSYSEGKVTLKVTQCLYGSYDVRDAVCKRIKSWQTSWDICSRTNAKLISITRVTQGYGPFLYEFRLEIAQWSTTSSQVPLFWYNVSCRRWFAHIDALGSSDTITIDGTVGEVIEMNVDHSGYYMYRLDAHTTAAVTFLWLTLKR